MHLKYWDPVLLLFFFFNDTATTEIYTLSLHDALPIYRERREVLVRRDDVADVSAREARADALLRAAVELRLVCVALDRKSTRLNSSHANISYAVFCLKKKKKTNKTVLHR